MDEFDLEVTDLRELDDPDDVEAGADDSDTAPVVTRRPFAAPAHPLLSRRLRAAHPLLSRRLRAALTGAAVLLVAAVLLLSIPQAQGTLAALLRIPTPVPPPPLSVGADTLILRHTVPWGVLRVDGAPVRHLETALVPPNTQGAQLPALTLARGVHTLSYDAPPFPALRCRVSVPAAPSDTCPLGLQVVTGPLETFGLARLVDLGATPALLPQPQHDALESAVAVALAAQSPATSLVAGEPYLAADGTPAEARAPLAATLRYALDTSGDSANPSTDDVCRPLCADQHDQGDLPAWLLAARLALSWQYAPAAGQPFAGAVAPGPPTAVYVDVQVTWDSMDGLWRVVSAPIDSQAECAVATARAQEALEQHRLSGRLSCMPTPDHIADGCLITAQPLDATGQPVGQELALYYRFGVLFSGNAAARGRLPELPAIGHAALALLPSP